MSGNENVRAYRGVNYVGLRTAWEVNLGDRVVCMLSDAVAAVKVTSITHREQDLTADGLDHTVIVEFSYTVAPWWVDRLMMSREITLPMYVAVPRPRVPTTVSEYWLMVETPKYDADGPAGLHPRPDRGGAV